MIPESKSTSPPTLPQGSQHQFKPIKEPNLTRQFGTPCLQEAQKWVDVQTEQTHEDELEIHKQLLKSRGRIRIIFKIG